MAHIGDCDAPLTDVIDMMRIRRQQQTAERAISIR